VGTEIWDGGFALKADTRSIGTVSHNRAFISDALNDKVGRKQQASFWYRLRESGLKVPIPNRQVATHNRLSRPLWPLSNPVIRPYNASALKHGRYRGAVGKYEYGETQSL
jgi:hypothetical protein